MQPEKPRANREEGSTEAVGPDFAQAGPMTCAACPYAILETRSKSFAEADLSDLNRKAFDGSRAGTLFEELERAQLARISSDFDDRFAAITALTPGLTGAEEGE